MDDSWQVQKCRHKQAQTSEFPIQSRNVDRLWHLFIAQYDYITRWEFKSYEQ